MSDCGVRHSNALRIELTEHRERDCGIAALMRSAQRERESGHIGERRLDQRRSALARDLLDDRARTVAQLSDDDRDAGFDDARLLERDRLERRSEIELMIERDRRDRAHRRRDDVGRVEPAAEADFDDGDVDLRSAKQLERDGGRHFEEGRLDFERPFVAQRLDEVAPVADRLREQIGRN